MLNRKFFLCILVLVSLFMTACPRQKDIKEAFKASRQIAHYTGTAADTVADLYKAGVIDFGQKEKLITKLKAVRDNGKRFHATVEAIYQQYKNDLPDKELNALDIVFNRDVIAPLIDLLTEAGLLSESASQTVLTALVFLKQAVLMIANLFGQLRPGASASFNFYLENFEFYENHKTTFEKELNLANV